MRVRGRIKSLIVSIKTSRGTRAAGAPAGAKWAADSTGNLAHPDKTIRVQKIKAREAAIQIFLVTP